MPTLDQVYPEAEARMKKCLEALHHELARIRTGRAHTGLLEGVMVSYYGQETPINQIASVVVADARTLTVTPWEKNQVQAIEKAIMASGLGLNPCSVGTLIRIPLPALTEDRRKELIRLVKSCGENAKVAVRNVRRDANNQLKDLFKEKLITEDDERRAQEKMQKLTDHYISEVDKQLAVKEADLMEI